MDILEILGWAVFFYLMWQLFYAWIAMQRIKHAVNNAIIESMAQQQLAEKETVIVLEHVKQGPYSVVLAVEKETGQFLGQGNTDAETQDMLQKRYPKKKFVIVDNDNLAKATANVI